ncbi:multidrug transporter EmrE-like cation transporter [Brachybacterium muris]|uniref:SMR family transporter n=1 Tax=Brachybacterium muris TaxID=219301 RepID=UPI00195DFB98|nr:SMR family transporter [Brachybacterium muris]MBM7502454.1 multidrug transporter EmrE-like cation transporter [Brachybacterium muris]
MSWAFMIAAVLSEVTATLTLKSAATGRPRLYLGVPLGYVLAFAFLTGALREYSPRWGPLIEGSGATSLP